MPKLHKDPSCSGLHLTRSSDEGRGSASGFDCHLTTPVLFSRAAIHPRVRHNSQHPMLMRQPASVYKQKAERKRETFELLELLFSALVSLCFLSEKL